MMDNLYMCYPAGRDQQQTGEYCMMLLLGLMPHGCYYLVDAGYTNDEGFLAPYRGQRYHLNEWRDGRRPVTPQECFNMRHSSARNVIERCFGMLKMRWTILRSPSFYPVRTHNRIITACCLLHNLIRRYSASDPMEDAVIEGDGEGDYAVNSTPMETHTISSIETSAAWSNWRDSLASEIIEEVAFSFNGGKDSTISLNLSNFLAFAVSLILQMPDSMSQEQQGRDMSQEQGGGSSKCPIRLWTPEEDKALVESMLELRLGSTFNADNGLTPDSYRDLEKKMESKLHGCFGWDSDRCMVTTEKDVWDNYIRSHKRSAPFRTKPFPLFEQLIELFGKDRANEKEAESAADYFEQLSNEGDMETTESSSSMKKRKKVKDIEDDVLNKAVDKICASMDQGLEKATKELCFHMMSESEVAHKVDELYNDLLLINGITSDDVYSAHVQLSTNPRQLLSYSHLPDHAKLTRIQSLLRKN
ncbi:protein ALP1-like [Senna tora]|uniref:Protein ALP1-like n=1 Tax=Senna tora TaxID=362788 RepID=A0A834SY92_9FABA|nr:protein ALP1-like [Senna tora]